MRSITVALTAVLMLTGYSMMDVQAAAAPPKTVLQQQKENAAISRAQHEAERLTQNNARDAAKMAAATAKSERKKAKALEDESIRAEKRIAKIDAEILTLTQKIETLKNERQQLNDGLRKIGTFGLALGRSSKPMPATKAQPEPKKKGQVISAPLDNQNLRQ